MTPLNGGIVFAADGNACGRELLSSDGTTHGTKMLQDINPGAWIQIQKISVLSMGTSTSPATHSNGRQIHKLDGS